MRNSGVFLTSFMIVLSISCISPAKAAEYPEHAVKVIVGFPPGGGNDVLARLLSERLQAAFSQPFVVENRPGANGFIAFDAVKRAAPDGHTLLIGPSSGMTVNPAVYESLPYDPVRDFEPISMIGGFPLIVTVNKGAVYKSLQDLISAARDNPGTIDYGSAATSFQLATEMFAQQAGIKLNHIPYKGSSQVVQAVRGNQVPMTFADSAAVISQIKSGDLRALAVSTAKRIGSLPDIPTVSESGLPGYDMLLWSGIFAPANTPAEIIQKLQSEVKKAVSDPVMVQRLSELGIEPIGSTSESLKKIIKEQIRKYKEVASKAQIAAK